MPGANRIARGRPPRSERQGLPVDLPGTGVAPASPAIESCIDSDVMVSRNSDPLRLSTRSSNIRPKAERRAWWIGAPEAAKTSVAIVQLADDAHSRVPRSASQTWIDVHTETHAAPTARRAPR